jgi:hypothetical protein
MFCGARVCLFGNALSSPSPMPQLAPRRGLPTIQGTPHLPVERRNPAAPASAPGGARNLNCVGHHTVPPNILICTEHPVREHASSCWFSNLSLNWSLLVKMAKRHGLIGYKHPPFAIGRRRQTRPQGDNRWRIGRSRLFFAPRRNASLRMPDRSRHRDFYPLEIWT